MESWIEKRKRGGDTYQRLSQSASGKAGWNLSGWWAAWWHKEMHLTGIYDADNWRDLARRRSLVTVDGKIFGSEAEPTIVLFAKIKNLNWDGSYDHGVGFEIYVNICYWGRRVVVLFVLGIVSYNITQSGSLKVIVLLPHILRVKIISMCPP